MKIQKLKKALKKGFTLIELLVVVAIIAVIGAGIAVTYRNIDDQAKVAMEISDMAAIKKVIKHWSAVRNFDELPNGMDLLVAPDGTMAEGLPGHPPFIAAPAPDEVINNLASAGIEIGYVHRDGVTPKNDATFEPGPGFPSSYDIDTSTTIRTLVAGDSATRTDAQEVVDNTDGDAHDYDPDGDPLTNDAPYSFTTTGGTDFGPYNSLADWDAEQADQQALLDAQTADTLAFIPPDLSYPSFLSGEAISNMGLTLADVADPREDYADEVAAGKKYYLVAMGLGRFSDLYRGASIRADGPPVAKRYRGDNYYSRYVAILKVNVGSAGHGSGVSPVSLGDVVSPAGYSAAALEDTFDDAKETAAADY